MRGSQQAVRDPRDSLAGLISLELLFHLFPAFFVSQHGIFQKQERPPSHTMEKEEETSKLVSRKERGVALGRGAGARARNPSR